MLRITTTEELIDCFKNAKDSERVEVLKNIEIPPSNFERFATWEKDCYTRNCLARNDDFEFILLCWDTGAKTPIHGHGGQNCWVYQVSGKVLENRFEESEEGFNLTNTITLEEGKLTYMNDKMGYHSLENVHGDRAMTLHIYACPIQHCKVYDEEAGCFEIKELKYDSVR